MRTRLLITGILFLTLLTSGWSSVIAATLCPHTMAQAQSCCHAMKMNGQDEAMGDMQMPVPASETSGDTGNAIAVGQPVAQCAHCVSHSSVPASLVFAVSAFQQSKQNTAVVAFQANFMLMALSSSFTSNATPKQRSAPETSTERHVLIGVFRI